MGCIKETEAHWENLILKIKTDLEICSKAAESHGDWETSKSLNQLYNNDVAELGNAVLDYYRTLTGEDENECYGVAANVSTDTDTPLAN